MLTREHSILRLKRFKDMDKWSATVSAFTNFRTANQIVPLGKVLKRIKEPITVKDDILYKRITVRLYGQGVFTRDELYGRDIGTKNQYIAHANQLIISRIDARNGAFGIVPQELDGAIVTNDFWLFDIHDAVPQYLALTLSSELFQQHWQTQSSGTTNRQRIDELSFLNSKIALPELCDQEKLVTEYNKTILKSTQMEEQAAIAFRECEDYLMDELLLHHLTVSANDATLRFTSFKNLATKWEWDSLSEAIEASIKDCKYPIKPIGNIVSFVNRSWKSKNCTSNSFMYIEIGGVNVLDNTVTANEVQIADAPSRATQTVQPGDLIIGTTRPYLKRFALIKESESGYVCSSGFQVIERSPLYDSRFIVEVLKLEPIIKQFESLMTGALYPAITADQLRQIRIPMPPIEVQTQIADYIEQVKINGLNLHQQAIELQKKAKKEFENAAFC